MITYEKLLSVFWSSHSPAFPPSSRQYMSIVFYHNEEQQKLALESRDREARARGKVYTEIVPFSRFYLAEAYHQKYWLQGIPELIKDFKTIYAGTNDFIASTAAARVNGYLGGSGNYEALQRELGSFGLSPAANKRLLDAVQRQK